jgi:hypothetical protein
MPAMPAGDPQAGIEWLRGVEESGRLGREVDLEVAIRNAKVDNYWKDLGLLLLTYKASRRSDGALLAHLKEQFYSNVYKMFVVAKLDAAGYSINSAGK